MLRHLVVVACLVGAPVALAACSEEEASVVQGALEQGVESADVDASLQIVEDGARKPAFAFALSGPMRSNGADELPSFDWRIRLAGEGEDTSEFRVMSSGRNLFVETEGETYELGEELTGKLNSGSAAGAKGEELDSLDDVEDQGIDLKAWFPESDTREDSRVGDEDTTRRLAAEARLDDDGDKGAIRLELTLSGVGEDKTIDVPERGRPIAELLRRFEEEDPAQTGKQLEVQ